MGKRFLFLKFFGILPACTTATVQPTVMASTASPGNPTWVYITAVLATKHAGRTAMAASMTAQPSEAPLPTVPPDSPYL